MPLASNFRAFSILDLRVQILAPNSCPGANETARQFETTQASTKQHELSLLRRSTTDEQIAPAWLHCIIRNVAPASSMPLERVGQLYMATDTYMIAAASNDHSHPPTSYLL
eukprot:6181946-Pleurochrysis_carterae.AAC.7